MVRPTHLLVGFDQGGFARLRADEPHYATTDGGAVVQIMGTGLFALEYVRP